MEINIKIKIKFKMRIEIQVKTNIKIKVKVQTPILGSCHSSHVSFLAASCGQVSPSCMAMCHSRISQYGIKIVELMDQSEEDSEEHSGIRGAYLLLWEGCQLHEGGVEAGSCRIVGTEARPLEIFRESFFFMRGGCCREEF